MSETCCGGACDTPGSDRPSAQGLPPAGGDRSAWLPTRLNVPWAVLAAGALIAIGAALAWAGVPLAAIGADILAIAVSIRTPARRAALAVKRRVLDINVLMIIAVVGAAILGDWSEAAAVVWLFGVAQWLETRSLERARHAIQALVTLSPTTATVRRSGGDEVVAVEAVVAGDLVVVRPGDRVPVDGVVRAGFSEVDQSPVTGESRPVEKEPGKAVFAGTINGTGALDIETTRPAGDSTIARIARLVGEAQRRRAPVQSLVDRFARWYTPAVVLVAIAVAVVPPFVMGGLTGWTAEFPVWSYRALALLVVACPCALVISTPVSIVSALTAAARHGVLIKGGSHLEQLGSVRCVAFDKTGTLTDSDVHVTDVHAVDGGSDHGVLSVAAALESRSEHPIGRAIVAHAAGLGIVVEPGLGFRALPGFGAEALVATVPAVVGNHRLFEQRQLCTPALHAKVETIEVGGGTPVLVSHGGQPLGLLTLRDRVRAGSGRAVRDLRREGISRVVLLTGDGVANAERVRADLNLDEAHAELLPADKVAAVERLRAAHGSVAMIGDGVNDAPALAAADVGIVMGVAGTDVALETADVALMADDLGKVPYAFRLARATLRNIRLNVGLAIGVKLVFVVLAAAGVATLWMAVLADTGASLLVTANSLRLLRVR